MIKNKRFEVAYKEGHAAKEAGLCKILVDRATGVNYLCWNSGYGAAITPLLDDEGKVVVTKNYFS